MFRVKVYNDHGMAQRNGTGMFPRKVINHFPLLPLEVEGRLNDMPLRENFIERVFHSPERSEGAYYRCTRMLDEESTPGGLVPGQPVQGGQVPYRPQADANGAPWRYQPGQAVRSITLRWAALSRRRASGTGTN